MKLKFIVLLLLLPALMLLVGGCDGGSQPPNDEVKNELRRVFLQTLDNTHDEQNRPISNMSSIRELEPDVFTPGSLDSEARALFWLHRYDIAYRVKSNPAKISLLYQEFLHEYLSDYNSFTRADGTEFETLIHALSDQLIKGRDGTAYGKYVDDLFGDHETGDKNRKILARIHNYGRSFGGEMGEHMEESMDKAKLYGEPIGVTFEYELSIWD